MSTQVKDPLKSQMKLKKIAFSSLTILLVITITEITAYFAENFENKTARKKNPFVESINPVPTFDIKDVGGVKLVVRSGFHPLMNTNIKPFFLEHPKNTLRIFVLGGSAAAGWPYHAGDTNLSALLERKLKKLYPNKTIEVINAAAGTYASHRVKFIFDEILHYNPDIIFLYNGNNEFLENLVYRPQRPPAPWDKSAAIRFTYRAAASLFFPKPQIDVKNYDVSKQEQNSLSFAFSKTSLYRQDQRQFQALLDHYRFNMEEMVKSAKQANIPLFLVTCPVNLKDWVPNVSQHRKDLTPDEKNKWTVFFRDGYLAVEQGNYLKAVEPLRSALLIDDEYAEAHFRLGDALRHTGSLAEAKREYILALQRDAYPFRELPEFQNILHEIATQQKTPVIDIIAPLEAAANDGIIGLDILTDYVHLTEQSQEIVAHEMLKGLFKQGLLPQLSATEIEGTRIKISPDFMAARDVMAADLNYNMAMIMHQYERIDALYEKAIYTFKRAANEDQKIAQDCKYRAISFSTIHPVVQKYRDLLRADKLGMREKLYTSSEAQRIFTEYTEMIRITKTPGLPKDEFVRKIPATPFQ